LEDQPVACWKLKKSKARTSAVVELMIRSSKSVSLQSRAMLKPSSGVMLIPRLWVSADSGTRLGLPWEQLAVNAANVVKGSDTLVKPQDSGAFSWFSDGAIKDVPLVARTVSQLVGMKTRPYLGSVDD